jgi:hypothetical protein
MMEAGYFLSETDNKWLKRRFFRLIVFFPIAKRMVEPKANSLLLFGV